MDETLKERLKKDLYHKDNSYKMKSFNLEVKESLQEIGNVERCHKFLDFLDDTLMRSGRWLGKDRDFILTAKNAFMGIPEDESTKILSELRGRYIPLK